MSDSIRRASGISDDAPRFGKGVTQADLLRHSWIRGSGIGEVPFTYAACLSGLTRAAALEVDGWVEGYVTGRATKGLLLTGPPGAGKTTLAKAIGLEILQKTPPRLLGWTPVYDTSLVRPVVFWAWADYLKAMRRRMDLQQRGQLEDEFHALDDRLIAFNLESTFYKKRITRLAIVDDIGKEYTTASGWAESELDTFLRSRGNAGLFNIATTNNPLATWDERYGTACGSYGHEAFHEVMVVSKDRRR